MRLSRLSIACSCFDGNGVTVYAGLSVRRTASARSTGILAGPHLGPPSPEKRVFHAWNRAPEPTKARLCADARALGAGRAPDQQATDITRRMPSARPKRAVLDNDNWSLLWVLRIARAHPARA